VPPLKMNPGFLSSVTDGAKRAGLRSVVTRVTRVDGTSYLENAGANQSA